MPFKPKTHRPPHKPQQRLSPRQRGYTTEWDKASKRFRQDHPFCAECLRQGILTASQVVDHIIPHKGNERLFWEMGNWAALCKPCHDSKTAREDGGLGNPMRQNEREAGCEGK